MKKLALVILAACWVSSLTQAQNTIGIPNIINYLRQDYKAGKQTWNIAQDRHGIMYFANNSGLLCFDGSYWRMYPLPNATIVRSVFIDEDNRIYVGGQQEFGYFYPNEKGELVYISLRTLLRRTDDDFADVWTICKYRGHIFFRANKKIFEYNGKGVAVYNSINWNFMSQANNELLAYDYEKGLLSFKNGQWRSRVPFSSFPKGIHLRNTIDFGKDSMLLASTAHGLYVLHGDSLSHFETPDVKEIAGKNIFGVSQIAPDRLALITNLAGCVIVDKRGKFIQRFTKKEGIQNNNVLSIFLDKDKNLWLGLDNGIDLITYNNAIKNIFPEPDDRNSGYTSIIYNNQLYLGLATGLYKADLQPGISDLSYTTGNFSFVENSKGQVWNLVNVNGQLLLCHNKSAFLVRNNTASVIDDRTGFWTFQPLTDSLVSSMVMAGTYNGVNFYNYRDNNFKQTLLQVTFESARYIVREKEVFYIVHPYKGMYKVSFNEQQIPMMELYKDTKHILSANHNHLYRIGKRMVLTSDNGIFEFDTASNDFVRSTYLENMFGDIKVDYLTDDKAGNIWFCSKRKLGVVEHSGGAHRIVYIPEIDERILANGFENINVIDSNNVLIAAEKGFFHINYALYKKSKHPLNTLIRTVRTTTRKGELIYGGHFLDSIPVENPAIVYRQNSIYFECTSVIYGQQHNTEYSYFLQGFDENWSDWTSKTDKEYTNLPAGDYVFQVKSRNNFDNESQPAGFSFTILPPWYQTWWAYTLYVLLFVGVIYWFYKRQQLKYKRREKIKLEEQQRRYAEEQQQLQILHELEIGKSEKQIIQLTNEKLQAELEHKNSELASSAMNLVRKKEMLSKIKADLNEYKKNEDIPKGGKEFQKIIRKIDAELDHDQEWEQFAVHFDNVHTNYLKKLKELYPDLTSSELKLAAYLRLNLSSKEIAQLMNISIRGVETSRYRLRKKLGLTTNESNLYDFLIKVGDRER